MMSVSSTNSIAVSSSQLVAVRVRPLIKREIKSNCVGSWKSTDREISRITNEPNNPSTFYFDRVFGPSENNWSVYKCIAKDIVGGAIQGINGTIFAYGQTSSGKTYTMMGSATEPGLIEYAVKDMFDHIDKASDRMFLSSMSYLEIYNEEVKDLLTGVSGLKIREAEDGSVYVENRAQELIESPEDVFRLISSGDKLRHVGSTNMNEMSSRSHAIASVYIESKLKADEDNGAVLVSQLNFVDLAGSEKASQTGAVGQRLKEGSFINVSLLTLSNCINKLADKSQHIPYRDSKLTRLLQNSLGGNSRTAIICNITPVSVDETLSTLRFATRAKKVSTKPTVNEVVNQTTLTRRLEKRIKELEDKLAEKSVLDSGIRHELFKDLFKQAPMQEEKQIHRRMTWCPGPDRKPDVRLLDLSTICADSVEGEPTPFKKPKPPGRLQRKRTHLDSFDALTESNEDLELVTGSTRRSEVIFTAQSMMDVDKADTCESGAVLKEAQQTMVPDVLRDELEELRRKEQVWEAEKSALYAEINSLKDCVTKSNETVCDLNQVFSGRCSLGSKQDYSHPSPNDDKVVKIDSLQYASLVDELVNLNQQMTRGHEDGTTSPKDFSPPQSLTDAVGMLVDGIASLKEKCSALMMEVQAAKSVSQTSIAENENQGLVYEQLRAELDTCKSELSERKALEIDLQDKISFLNFQLETTSTNLTEFRELNQMLENELAVFRSDDKHSKTQHLESDIEKNDEVMRQAELAMAEEKILLQSEVLELRRKLTSAEEMLANVAEKSLSNEATREELALCLKDYQSLQSDYKLCKTDLELSLIKITDIEHEAVALRNDLASYNSFKNTTDLLKADYDQLKTELECCQAQNDQHMNEVKQLENELSLAKLDIEEHLLVKAELCSLQDKLADYEEVLAEQEVYKGEITKLKTKIDVLENEICLSKQLAEEKFSRKEESFLPCSYMEGVSERMSTSLQENSDDDHLLKRTSQLEEELTVTRTELEKLQLTHSEEAINHQKTLSELEECRFLLSSYQAKIIQQEDANKKESELRAAEKDTFNLHQADLGSSAEVKELNSPGNEPYAALSLPCSASDFADEMEVGGNDVNHPLGHSDSEHLTNIVNELERCKDQLSLQIALVAQLQEELVTAKADLVDYHGLRTEVDVLRMEQVTHSDYEEVKKELGHLKAHMAELVSVKAQTREQENIIVPSAEHLQAHLAVADSFRALIEVKPDEGLACMQDERREMVPAQVECSDLSVQTEDVFLDETSKMGAFISQLKEENIDLKKGLDMKEHDLKALESGYERLQKEYNELIEYSNLEKEVYSCRTPGQVKEKQLRAEINNLNVHYQATVRFYEEELSRQRVIIENSGSKHKRGLSPLAEHSPAKTDISLNSEEMPDLMLASMVESPSMAFRTNLFNETASVSAAQASPCVRQEAATMTDIDFSWFGLDDTILTEKRTACLNSSVFQTPAKSVDRTFLYGIKADVEDFKTGLETAYITIEELNTKSAQDSLKIKALEASLDKVKGKSCGSCCADVLECDHKEYVATSDWRDAQQDLESQITEKLSTIACLELQLATNKEGHKKQIEQMSAENDFMLEAAKKQKMHLSDGDINEMFSSKIEEVKIENNKLIAELMSKYDLELKSANLEHQSEQQRLKFEKEEEILALKAIYNTKIDDIQHSNSQALCELKDSHAQALSELKDSHAQALSELKQNHAQVLSELEQSHSQALCELKNSHSCEIASLQGAHEQKIKELVQNEEEARARFVNEMDQLQQKESAERSQLESRHRMELSQMMLELESKAANRENSHMEMDQSESQVEDYKKEINNIKLNYENIINSVKSEADSQIRTQQESVEKLKHKLEEESNILMQRHLQEITKLNQQHNEQINMLNRNNSESTRLLKAGFDETISVLSEKHTKELSEIRQRHSEEVSSMTGQHCAALELLQSKHQSNLQSAESRQLELIGQIRADHELDQLTKIKELEELKVRHVEEVAELENDKAKCLQDLDELNKKCNELKSLIDELKDQNVQALAEKQQEFEGFMTDALADRRKLNQKYVETRDKLHSLQEDIKQLCKEVLNLEDGNITIIKEKIVELKSSTNQSQQPVDVESLKAQILKEARQSQAAKLFKAEKILQENQRLIKTNEYLQRCLDNPEGQVKEALEARDIFKKNSEKYFDELCAMEVAIQTFCEENFGDQGWNLEDLLEKVKPYIPQALRDKAAAEMESTRKAGIVAYPKVQLSKFDNVPCEYMRKRQHQKIVALETDKAGLEVEVMRLQKEMKQIEKLHSEVHDLKQQLHKARQEYEKLDDLFKRTEQELYALRESRQPSNTPLKTDAAPPTSDMVIQLKNKTLQYENYRLQTSFDKLSSKYKKLRESYAKVSTPSEQLSAPKAEVCSAPGAALSGNTAETTSMKYFNSPSAKKPCPSTACENVPTMTETKSTSISDESKQCTTQ